MAQDKGRERRAMREVGLDPTQTFAQGAGTSQFDPETGTAVARIDPRIADFQSGMLGESLDARSAGQAGRAAVAQTGQEASSVSQGLFGDLRRLSSGDPLNIAQQQLQRMDAVLRPQREQRRSALEGRLLAQGRLGGTGASQELSELEGQFNRDRQGFLNQQLESASRIQNQALQTRGGLAAQAGMLGADIQQGQFGQGMQAGQTGTNVAQLAMQLQSSAPALANQLLMGEISEQEAVQAFNTKNQKQGSATQRAFGMGGALLGGAIAVGTGNPQLAEQAALAGGQIGGGIGGFF